MVTKIKLLLVEDEQTLACIIKDTLNENGFEVDVAYNGEEALAMFRNKKPDVIVTDIMMPTMDGFSFVERVRGQCNKTPILFLSARSSADDVVHGFEKGGNDYLRKPFAMSELIIRVKSLLGKIKQVEQEVKLFELGSFRFDAKRCTLSIGEKTISLSNRESDVLLFLCRNSGEIVPNRTILLDLWGDDSYFNARSLHVFITKLRHHLSCDQSVQIINLRGVGYKITVD